SAAPSEKVKKKSQTPTKEVQVDRARQSEHERQESRSLSPAARVHAEARGIDPQQVTGTGRSGRITKEDVHRATAGNGPPVMTAPTPLIESATKDARETRQRMTPIRQRIAQRLLESQQTTASLTTFNEADMSRVMALRSQYKDKFLERHG